METKCTTEFLGGKEVAERQSGESLFWIISWWIFRVQLGYHLHSTLWPKLYGVTVSKAEPWTLRKNNSKRNCRTEGSQGQICRFLLLSCLGRMVEAVKNLGRDQGELKQIFHFRAILSKLLSLDSR